MSNETGEMRRVKLAFDWGFSFVSANMRREARLATAIQALLRKSRRFMSLNSSRIRLRKSAPRAAGKPHSKERSFPSARTSAPSTVRQTYGCRREVDGCVFLHDATMRQELR